MFCRPYSLTNIYYARTVVSHLINTYLTVKWVQMQLTGEIHPEFVVNFFVQWLDCINMHSQQDVDNVVSKIFFNLKLSVIFTLFFLLDYLLYVTSV